MTPDTHTIEEKMLDVGDSHQLYVQVWGNPDAADAFLFLHGGPGSGCNDKQKSLFDPQKHKVVFFDQRGAGKSLPYGSLESNDTDHLIEDITKVTASYGIEKFTITGGSWGSTLALAYALRYPEKVSRLVLRGIFTGRKEENEFLYQGQFRAFYPEVWQAFVESVPAENRQDPSGYHMQRVFSDNAETSKRSAYALALLEGSLVSLDDRNRATAYEDFDPAQTIIESHFLFNHCFMEENYIFKNAAKLTMPISLVQGRFDAICPPVTAYELAARLPNARLYWTTAGHSGNDRANWDLTRALLAA